MPRQIFDYDSGEFINPISDDMGIDSDGNFHIRIGDNMSMNLETGDLHVISGWDDENNED